MLHTRIVPCLIALVFVQGSPLSSSDQNESHGIAEKQEKNTVEINSPEESLENLLDELNSQNFNNLEANIENKLESSEPMQIEIWNEPEVFYDISALSGESKVTVMNAMKKLDKISCVNFKEHKAGHQGKFLNFVQNAYYENKEIKCWANDPKKRNNTPTSHIIGVDDRCDVGTVTRLIMKVLGIVEEHRRADRDQYVTLHPNNCLNKTFFDIQTSKVQSNFKYKFPYDYNSITHLAANEYSKSENERTIEATKNKDVTFQAEKNRTLSIMDVMKVNLLFECFSSESKWMKVDNWENVNE